MKVNFPGLARNTQTRLIGEKTHVIPFLSNNELQIEQLACEVSQKCHSLHVGVSKMPLLTLWGAWKYNITVCGARRAQSPYKT